MKIGFVYKGKLIKKIKFSSNKPQEVIIGRSASADVSMADVSTLSSRHAQLFFDGSAQLHIMDLNSSNGTFINGARIDGFKTLPVRTVDKIEIGGVQLVLNPDAYEQRSGSDRLSSLELDMGQNYTDIIEKLSKKEEIILGRDSSCDVVLNYGFISRQHASIRKKGPDSFVITDLGSLNGTYINGKRINKADFTSKDDFFLGRLKLSLRGHIRDLSNEVAIRVERIVKRFSNNKVGLHETTFEIPAKSLLAIMGPSGCGKSTLLKALNGDSPVTSGKVYICGLELNENFDLIKNLIGYVPQDDIVHRELTVEQSLRYAAKLRLSNVSDADIDAKIDSVLASLNIEIIKGHRVSKISGGQRKRVSIAVELLNDPTILFLDEPTSPLDPETIENFLESMQKLAQNGTTVVMVTHKPEDLEYMQSVIFMAEGGHLVYFDKASRDAYLQYFNVEKTPRIYSNLVNKQAEKWITKYKQTNPSKPNTDSRPQPPKSRQKTNYFSQYFWLTRRYFSIKLNDQMNSAIMVGQAPLIATLVLVIFSEVYLAVPFLLTISALWFGATNAAREIVAELPIYKRERMFNQGIFPYILSKFTVLSTFAAVQCFIFTLFMYFGYHSCGGGEKDVCVTWQSPEKTFLWMLFISGVGTLMGLLLSAVVSTTEKVMSLVPIVLIPQLMLAGVIAKIGNKAVEFLSYLTISRWGTEGFAKIQGTVIYASMGVGADGKPTGEEVLIKKNASEILNKSFLQAYQDKIYFGELTGTLRLDFLALTTIGVIFFICLYLALKVKDPIKIS
ncbi:MAG: FHA domain-containing protein [Bacteroidetes bacterium]|nr:FHA domain-containing protein [Bacteroidota bacterium]